MGYKIESQPTKIWTPPDPFPLDLAFAIDEGVVVDAHNAQFERAIWRYKLHEKRTAFFYEQEYELGPVPTPRKWRDTMAVCAYRSLPLSLDAVGDVLGLKFRKDKRGKDVLRKLSRPRKPTKAHPNTRMEYDHAASEGLWDILYEYCIGDVDVEAELAATLGWLPQGEAEVWQLDQQINQRGIYADIPAAAAAIKLAAEHNKSLGDELCAMTNDSEMTVKKVARFKQWLASKNLILEDLQKDTVEHALGRLDPLEHPEAHRALKIRQQLSINSVSKLKTILDVANTDHRMRGLCQYHGSGTGRWAGRHFQPQNIPRPTATNALDKKGRPYLDEELLMDHLQLEGMNIGTLDVTYGDVASALTSSLRGMLIAEPGKRFYVSDFSAIEARVTMWLAGQKDKVDAFFAYDQGIGSDIYCVAAEDLYDYKINKHDHPNERQLGKIQILGCGYQMSGLKLVMTAAKQGVVLTEEQGAWIVQSYREKNPKVVRLWYGLQEAVITAIGQGFVTTYQGVEFRTVQDKAGKWLRCKLPSGRFLWYFDPKLGLGVSWNGQERWSITYQSRDNKRGGAWGTVHTYGGMLTENVVQAISRDLLVAAMFRVEEAGYPLVLTVHDEVVCETDYAFGDMDEFNAIVSGPVPPWAHGCPVAAAGWTGSRYKKE